ncbi:hypothetical protein IC229_30910 [Spirosoma sp. BT702]|uniref:Uncharacterized protein n=1 Tax=Spirosoma profusum TaxID=2771354 RepID=A0A927AVB1_9BACT|nr:hypothetical protein [Spirosoma profusum]MBD2705077.1 hypothetical protein [Spirosoma profusum]
MATISWHNDRSNAVPSPTSLVVKKAGRFRPLPSLECPCHCFYSNFNSICQSVGTATNGTTDNSSKVKINDSMNRQASKEAKYGQIQ